MKKIRNILFIKVNFFFPTPSRTFGLHSFFVTKVVLVWTWKGYFFIFYVVFLLYLLNEITPTFRRNNKLITNNFIMVLLFIYYLFNNNIHTYWVYSELSLKYHDLSFKFKIIILYWLDDEIKVFEIRIY